MEIEVNDIENFVFKLVRSTENMRIILGETPYAHQTMQGSGSLISVHGPQLAPANGELPVTVFAGVEDPDMKGTVHGFKLVFDLIDFHGRIHIFAVEIKMSRSLP